MLHDAEAAYAAICKNSKVRTHYLKLVLMCNVMRAFWVAYSLPADFGLTQEAFLSTLVRVEERKRRDWMTADKIAVTYALEWYTVLLHSATEEQIEEMVEYVDYNRAESKWAIREKK